jgi:hypothetical protein
MSIAENSAMDRVLRPLSECLTREAAARVLEFQIDDSVQARVRELAELANEGALTAEERSEYQSYIDAADMVTLFKLKARRLLESSNGS